LSLQEQSRQCQDRRTAIGAARAAFLVLLTASALVSSGCGENGGPPPPRGTQDSPAGLVRQSNELLGGGEKDFKEQIEALRGHPIVVNKWASWCGPCRFEFPFFQRLAKKHGKTIAFLGVDSRDSKEEARDFLEEYPVPYPSYYDRKGKVARLFRGDRAFPTTAFYNREGDLAFTKQGGYASEAAIAEDIRQYAR
jgi:cytochrome c biogenesis protein CcmG, thiol:disulfide interchange protein DsbE